MSLNCSACCLLSTLSVSLYTLCTLHLSVFSFELRHELPGRNLFGPGTNHGRNRAWATGNFNGSSSSDLPDSRFVSSVRGFCFCLFLSRSLCLLCVCQLFRFLLCHSFQFLPPQLFCIVFFLLFLSVCVFLCWRHFGYLKSVEWKRLEPIMLLCAWHSLCVSVCVCVRSSVIMQFPPRCS